MKKTEKKNVLVLRRPEDEAMRRFPCLQDCLLTLTCHLACNTFQLNWINWIKLDQHFYRFKNGNLLCGIIWCHRMMWKLTITMSESEEFCQVCRTEVGGKLRLLLVDRPWSVLKGHPDTPDDQQSPWSGFQSQPIHSTMWFHNTMWTLTITIPKKDAEYRQQCR